MPRTQRKHDYIIVTLVCIDPQGKILLSWDAKHNGYWFPFAYGPDPDVESRPVIDFMVKELNMDPTLPIWQTATQISPSPDFPDQRFHTYLVRTEIPGKNKGQLRYWATPAQLKNPDAEHPLVANRPFRSAEQYVTSRRRPSPSRPQGKPQP